MFQDVFHGIDRFACGFMVDPDLDFRHKPKADELKPGKQKQNGHRKKRPVGRNGQNIFFKGHPEKKNTPQKHGGKPPKSEHLDRLCGKGQQKFHRDQIEDHPDGS